MKVFLVGYMGVGKTTIGKKLGRLLQLSFIDLDQNIEQKEQRSISNIIETQGENHFRVLEKQCVEELEGRDDVIISTGGGTPCHNNMMTNLKQQGVVVWLEMPETAMINRLKNSKDRPLIANKSLEELSEFVHVHYSGRIATYKEAHIVFNALSVNAEKLKELAGQIQSYSI